jgi:hypothetical protein
MVVIPQVLLWESLCSCKHGRITYLEEELVNPEKGRIQQFEETGDGHSHDLKSHGRPFIWGGITITSTQSQVLANGKCVQREKPEALWKYEPVGCSVLDCKHVAILP